MVVLFLILNYKTYDETISLVDDLLNDNLEDKHILIVDNASPNESFIRLNDKYRETSQVEVIQSNENGGFAKGNNYGLRYAKKYEPSYVCIINNDVRFKMSTIDRLCSIFDILPNAAFIAPVQILPDGRQAIFRSMDIPTIWKDLNQFNPFSSKIHLYIENTAIKGIHKIGMIPGAFIFTKYSLFEKLDFFYEGTFLFCEERFIARKAADAGFVNYIILDEAYLHDHSTTIKNEASIRRQSKMILEGKCLYYKEYSNYPFLCKILLYLAFYMNDAYSTAISVLIKFKNVFIK